MLSSPVTPVCQTIDRCNDIYARRYKAPYCYYDREVKYLSDYFAQCSENPSTKALSPR